MAALNIPDEHLKSLREALCSGAAEIGNSPRNRGQARGRIDRISEVIREIDRHRPLGPDGKHGNRHTDTCGCEDK